MPIWTSSAAVAAAPCPVCRQGRLRRRRVLGWTSSRGRRIWPRGRRILPPPGLSASDLESKTTEAFVDGDFEQTPSSTPTAAAPSSMPSARASSTASARRPPHKSGRLMTSRGLQICSRCTPILLSKKLVCHYLYKKVTNERATPGTLVEVDLHALKPWKFPGVPGIG